MRALVAGILLTGLASSAVLAAPHQSREDAYILAVGDSWTSGGIDLDELGGMRRNLAGDFLWFRRAGISYRVDDPAVLAKASRCFEALRALDPEQEAFHGKEESLDAKEDKLDRQQDEVDSDLEDLDADEEAGIAVDPSERGTLERQRDELEPQRRTIEAEQRELAAVERDLDRREEALEADAEAALWRLIDETIAGGSAKKLPPR